MAIAVSGWIYRHLIRPPLFRFDPETMHHAALRTARLSNYPPLNWLTRLLYAAPESKPVKLFGLNFPNRIGLAAGFDKDGTAWPGLANLGFGHIEIGTITLRPQPGNPQPRIFRLPEQQAVINRLGFPGAGADAVLKAISNSKIKRTFILGINLGKSKDTPLEQAGGDYTELLKKFAPVADYLVVNISSPNTKNLRQLQGHIYLDNLLCDILTVRAVEELRLHRKLPVLVKLSPDLEDTELDEALAVLLDRGVDGIIATNTTLDRNRSVDSSKVLEAGGLSGRPLRDKSTRLIRNIVKRTQNRLPVIGVGGIDSLASAREKLDAGAQLLQIYTGLIYQGPGLVKRLVRALGDR